MGVRDQLRDHLRDEDGTRRRRALLLLLLLLLVVGGAGLGGFVPGFGGPDGPSLSIEGTPTPSPTPPPGSPTPTTTATPADGGPVASPTSPTPTPGDTPTASRSPSPPTPSPTPPGTATPTGEPPTATPGGTPTPTETPPTTASPPPTETPTSTPPPTTPPTTTPPGENPLELTFDGDSVIFDYQGVAPGQTGTETVTLANEGAAAGNLSIATIAAVDVENGIVGGEVAVDETPNEGELSSHLRLGLSITYSNGTTVALFGTGDGPRPVAALAAIENRSASGRLQPGESATVTVSWVLPASTGNEVQSDEVVVDVTFELRHKES